MKRIISLLLIICFLFCGCSKSTEKPKDSSSDISSNVKDDVSSKDDTSSETDNNENSSIQVDNNDSWVSSMDNNSSNNNSSNNNSSNNSLSSDISSNEDIDTQKNSEILPLDNSYCLMNPQTSGANKEASVLREKIRNAKDNIQHNGTVYYVSVDGQFENDGKSKNNPWDINALIINAYMIESGDTILFKRGDIFRLSSSITTISGVTYGAYGDGPKPAFYGSIKNYAADEIWYPSDRKYIWKTELPMSEAGIVVFNHGESVGQLYLSMRKLSKNGDFYHDLDRGILYLYCDKGYPDLVYDSIEIGCEGAGFAGSYVNDVKVDNLKFLYYGGHSMHFTSSKNVCITNCEIGWGGGAYLADTGERYGNGIEFWNRAENITVENCWVYQIYDAGLTFQSNSEEKYKNIKFNNNLIEYCCYSIELFASPNSDVTNEFNDIYIIDNILRLSGYGWGMQRRYPPAVSHINGWQRTNTNLVSNFVIKNNIFDCSSNSLIYWGGFSGLDVSNNCFYQKKPDKLYHELLQITPTPAMNFSGHNLTSINQSELEQAISVFDSTPNKVKWVS